MNLSRFPRKRYTTNYTAIEQMPNLEKILNKELNGNCPKLYIKRDDLLGLSGGGNKTRKLEFLVADALEKGADTLITCGAIQSNHARLTLSAAVKEGLKCQLALEERVPGKYNPKASGNNFLYNLLGVESYSVHPKGTNMMQIMLEMQENLKKQGRNGYIIPGGGSNEIGALGYVSCAQEMLMQMFDQGIKIDHIILASGSAGTHSGMLTGIHLSSANIPISGISVMRKESDQIDLVHGLCLKILAKLNVKTELPKSLVTVKDQYVGEGYSIPTQGMIDSVQLLAKTEGILLDPVYTGKAFHGFLDMIRTKTFSADESIIFLHTGGSPVLYAYQNELMTDNGCV
jgi:D-cysteine desulfhydrase